MLNRDSIYKELQRTLPSGAVGMIYSNVVSFMSQSLREPKDGGFQSEAFEVLAGAYALVGLIALIQLIRIERRVPEYGWTTQKVFHLLNFIVTAIRAGVFLFHKEVEALSDTVVARVLLDLPGLLFFSTYTLLVLFWAEIYHQARGLATDNLRPFFFTANALVYCIQAVIWAAMLFLDTSSIPIIFISRCFFAAVSLIAAIGFLIYGGRLFLMLRRFPIESRGRRKKLHEVGLVTLICATCFTVRAFMIAFAGDIDVLLGHAILDFIYYFVVELLPAALVLYILRKLPPKRNTNAQQLR